MRCVKSWKDAVAMEKVFPLVGGTQMSGNACK